MRLGRFVDQWSVNRYESVLREIVSEGNSFEIERYLRHLK
jgi:hypothetical protein